MIVVDSLLFIVSYEGYLLPVWADQRNNLWLPRHCEGMSARSNLSNYYHTDDSLPVCRLPDGSQDRQDAARAAGNFVANNAHAFWGNKRICKNLTIFAFLRAKYCHVAVHQAKNDILI